MSSAGKPSGLVQGTLDMLILKTLALEPMHGYGIGARIEQISKGVFQVNAGSVFHASVDGSCAHDSAVSRTGSFRTKELRSVSCFSRNSR